MEPILEVKNLKKTFGQTGRGELEAVRGISFRLYPGESLGIVGESGCGKSTVARLITRLIDVTEGNIFLKGEDITRADGRRLREVYRSIQMVFQSPVESFDPRRTLGDAVGESLRNAGMPVRETQQRTAELLEECGLPAAFARRYPHEVSAGQYQRAAIARAIAIQPEILLCDEATSALDVSVQQQIVELLQRLRRRQGMAYLFISHDLALVQQLCERILVMHQGVIVEEGTAEQVIMAPKSAYTRQLLDSVL